MAYIRKQGGFTPDMLREAPLHRLIDKTTDALMQGVDYGLANSEIPAAMADKLSESVFVFSGCKTYQELREASQLLRDEGGQVKPFGRFYKEVKALHSTYNEQYLDAEYRFAVHSAQAAAQWADIEQDGDEYDLQYRTANDGKVRLDHAVLEGITLPPSDPFWRQYYPPNGWRCRCRAIQVRRGKTPQSDSDTALQLGAEATTKVDKQGRNKAEMFRFNPGLDQIVFPPHHPYYNLSVQAKGVITNMADDKFSAPVDMAKIAERRKEIRNLTKDLPLRTFKNADFDDPILITTKRIKEWLNQPHKHIAAKNEMLTNIDEVIRHSKYIGSGDDSKNGSITLHLFETHLEGDPSWIIVREMPFGGCFIHSVSDGANILKQIKKPFKK